MPMFKQWFTVEIDFCVHDEKYSEHVYILVVSCFIEIGIKKAFYRRAVKLAETDNFFVYGLKGITNTFKKTFETINYRCYLPST